MNQIVRRTQHIFILLFLLLSVKLSAFHKNLVLTNSTEELWLESPELIVFQDTTRLMTINEIVSRHEMGFYDTEIPCLIDHPSSAYWLHFTLIDKREIHTPHRLEFYDFNIDEATLYWKRKEGKLDSSSVIGFHKPFSLREIEHKNLIFNLDFLNKDTTDIYIKIESPRVNMITPVIKTYNRFFNYAISEYLFFGIFYGLTIFIILYNLVYFFILKEQHFLYYILYALGVTVFLMCRNGTAFQYLWPNYPDVNPYIDHIALHAGITGLLLFSIHYLNLKTKYPRLYKLTLGVTITWVIVFAFQLVFQTYWLNEFVEVLVVQFVFFLGFTLKKEDGFAYRTYLIAFVILNFSFIITYLESINYITSNVYTVYAVYGGLLAQYFSLSIGMAERTRNSLKQLTETQQELLDFKEETNHRLEEKVNARTAKINEQNEIIISRNKHIMDSVYYAKNIQSAILPSLSEIRKTHSDFFVLNIPRDVVSGDFHLVHPIDENEFLVVVADCTGHGVPGALMSMISVSAIKNLISRGVTKPAEILSQLHLRINSSLKQHETKNEDGMDGAIILVNRKSRTVEFSGAKSSLLILKEGDVTRLKGTRESVGGTQHKESPVFSSNVISYNDGQNLRLLMSTDGFLDQFGGPNEEKYGLKRLKSFLLKEESTGIKRLGQKMEIEIIDWKGSNIQIDDILVFGIDLI